MTEQEKKELLDELEKRIDEKYKGCLTREDAATTLKAPREKKIWESDIISYQRDNDDCPFPNKDTKKRFGKVFYQGFRSTFAIGMGKNGSRSINDDLWKYVQNGNRVEVIGNQFDNPELLQEES